MEKESFSQPEVKEQDISEGTDGLTQFKRAIKNVLAGELKLAFVPPPPSSSFKSFQKYITHLGSNRKRHSHRIRTILKIGYHEKKSY